MSEKSVIELNQVEIKFDSRVILQPLSLQIFAGESVVLIGPSGQGKTTLLKLMAGLLSPTSGSVKVFQKDWQSIFGAERTNLLKRVGMLFQKNALFDSFTCGENIAFPLRETTKKSDVEIDETVDFFLQAVGLPHAKDLYPDEISGGMQKRLGIARALALRPELIFYDDPTAGLDPITSRKIIELIIQLKKENNSTVVAITNDMNRAYQLADRIGFVGGQEFLETGSPEQTKKFDDPRVQQFIQGSTSGPLTTL